jgi:toxin ParE1/3/4
VKRLALRSRAEVDLIEITQWYVQEGGLRLGERFFDEARAAAARVAAMPGIGSARVGNRIGMAGLRSWPVHRFPVRWWYIEQDDCIDVIRLLGERQDVEAILADGPD